MTIKLDHARHEITITTKDGELFTIEHDQECCETVKVYGIVGWIPAMIGSEVHGAGCRCLSSDNEEAERLPDGVSDHIRDGYDSWSWTLYTLATVEGEVQIQWLGVSNGYYSEMPQVWRKLKDYGKEAI